MINELDEKRNLVKELERVIKENAKSDEVEKLKVKIRTLE
jgi:hypothetical protein